jgi:hypothetical protein
MMTCRTANDIEIHLDRPGKEALAWQTAQQLEAIRQIRRRLSGRHDQQSRPREPFFVPAAA